MPPEQAEGARVADGATLYLRQATLDDAEFVRTLVTQPSWVRSIAASGVVSQEDARQYIQTRLLDRYATHGFGLWLVARQADCRLIGMAGLVHRDSLPGPDLGFALLDEHVGRGYAFEAASVVMRVARLRYGLAELYAVVKPDNRRSIQLLQRLGFAYRHDQLGTDGLRLQIHHCALAPGTDAGVASS
ncbi:MAG: GNAT family N-acetyltransferase [Abyssibacter sp.]|jgi:[ribosomal protein S5]-alanine N-acetyltransferase|uniref:GNAT family N-acetyltransferase n=1 Tax=Abyssibacter sp. TaxID=2320200 RepID=UPI003219A511